MHESYQMYSFPHFSITQQQIKEEILKVPTFQSDIPQWDFTDIVCEMLYQFADMVSSVSVVPEVEDFDTYCVQRKKVLASSYDSYVPLMSLMLKRQQTCTNFFARI